MSWCLAPLIAGWLELAFWFRNTPPLFFCTFPSLINCALASWCLPRWRSRGGAGSRWRPAGDVGAQTHGRSIGHGRRLHSDSIRSAQNCKLCFPKTGYYLQQFLFLQPKAWVGHWHAFLLSLWYLVIVSYPSLWTEKACSAEALG